MYKFLIFFTIIFGLDVKSQSVNTTIVGNGSSCQEAKNDALRNAITKAYGSVIYSKTEINNDMLISDDITMLTSGNILNYEEVTPCAQINGIWSITLDVKVSQTELKAFIEGKGKSISISGELLKQKSDQELLLKNNEASAIKNILLQLNIFTKEPFNFELSMGQITIKDGKYCDLPVDITIKSNINFFNIGTRLTNEIEKISINQSDQIFRSRTLLENNYSITINSKIYYLRDPQSIDQILKFHKSLLLKIDEYTVVDDCLNELTLSSKSNTESNYYGYLTFPEPGTQFKKISGKFMASIDEIGSLNRINIFAIHKLAEYRNGKALSRELALIKYSETNPLEFDALKNQLRKALIEFSKETNAGKIKLNYNIIFNNIGNNNSSISSIIVSDPKFKSRLESSINMVKLNPSKLCGNFTSTTDEIGIDYKWDTKKIRFAFESSKENEYSKYFNLNGLPYGTYILTVTDKEFNGTKFKDVKISDYKTRGPLNVINSILIPGWGKRRVTYNEKKGWGIFFFVVTPSILSLTSKLISDNYYKKYHEAVTQNEIDHNYEKANKYHKTALNLFCIGTAFYIYDIVYVLRTGFKNVSRKNNIKKQIMNNQLQIQQESI